MQGRLQARRGERVALHRKINTFRIGSGALALMASEPGGEEPMTKSMAVLQRVQVMVVDDNHHMRTLMRTILNAIGIRDVVEAPDGAAALEILNARVCDILIVDHQMPVIDGVELVSLLRRSDNHALATLPILMVTGHSDRATVSRARDAGINGFLAKPVSAKDLLSRVEAVLRDDRAFYRSARYAGPDRRRMLKLQYGGVRRRKADAAPHNGQTP